jgi:hypothetical protein
MISSRSKLLEGLYYGKVALKCVQRSNSRAVVPLMGIVAVHSILSRRKTAKTCPTDAQTIHVLCEEKVILHVLGRMIDCQEHATRSCLAQCFQSRLARQYYSTYLFVTHISFLYSLLYAAVQDGEGNRRQ